MRGRRTRILVVEDEWLLASALEEAIRDWGCEVIGPVATVGDALEAIDDAELDGAVLDYRLGAETADPVAAALKDRGVPFLFVTASPTAIREDAGHRAVLQKPVDPDQLLLALGPATGAGIAA